MKIKLSNKNVLVIGGNGFLGKSIAPLFHENGYQVNVIDHNTPKGAEYSEVNYIQGNGLDIKFIKEYLNKYTVVIFLGGSSRPAYGYDSISEEVEVEVIKVLQLVEFCSNEKIQQFIFASSGGTVYGKNNKEICTELDLERPINSYGYSKLMIEAGIRLISNNNALKSTVLRISNPYGPNQKTSKSQGFIAAAIDALKEDTTLTIWGDGSIVRDFVYVEDVANSFLLSLNTKDHFAIFNIGSGVENSLVDVCEALEKVSGKKLKINYQSGRKVDIKKNVLDISLASLKMQWVPKFELSVGLNKTFYEES